MNNICDLINNKRIYFDGGLGTVLQSYGMRVDESPEMWNLSHPDIITKIHEQYIASGSNIITTNTFGVNCLKYENYDEYIRAAITCAKKAKKDRTDVFIAFDIGPLGRFLKPIGDVDFEEAISVFARNIRVAAECGVDLIIIETMTDSYETKAAVLAGKENSSLPIFVTNVYDESGKTLTGSTPEAMLTMLEGLGVDAIGVNCSLGPDKMIPIVERMSKCTSLPIIANPNAGLPVMTGDKATYSMDASAFSDYGVKLALSGANILGGCCGTNPEYIRQLVEKTRSIPLSPVTKKHITKISSYTHSISIGEFPVLIGERINPTGKPKLKQAIADGNLNYVMNLALQQADLGVHVLDVNVGVPGCDEKRLMHNAVFAIQSVCDLPLQIDSNVPDVLEASMRIYNGKPLINSVNGDNSTMDTIFPLVKKYGGTVIALTLDEKGIPDTAKGRLEIAHRIIEKAKEYGIESHDIIFDPLALTISTNPDNALITLETLDMLSQRGYKTCLGISNVSFGMPDREKINSRFFALALLKGLSCAIMNPNSTLMMNVYRSYDFLTNNEISYDDLINSIDYHPEVTEPVRLDNLTLNEAIVKGMIDETIAITESTIKNVDSLTLINEEIIPALNFVGSEFEQNRIYLPQLLRSAECASKSFEVIKNSTVNSQDNGKKIIIATVKGDVHDIGKNIVRLLIESYGYNVIDLGKDVSAQRVLDAVKQHECQVVALSALMTTTLPAMKETVELLHSYDSNIKVMVGGAVLTQEYANSIGADGYGKDAITAVKIVESFYNARDGIS